MPNVFFDMLPFALGIAVSPVPVITVILMLFTPRPAANGTGFLLGWFIGIGLPALVILIVDQFINEGRGESAPSGYSSFFRLFVGILLLALSLRNWLLRHRKDDPNQKSILIKVVDTITPWKAVVLGFLFADVTNPKNLALTVAGCLAIRQGQLSPVGSGLMLLLFAVISSLGIAIPVLVYLSGGEGAQARVEGWKQALTKHKKMVMAVLFFVLGLWFIWKSIP